MRGVRARPRHPDVWQRNGRGGVPPAPGTRVVENADEGMQLLDEASEPPVPDYPYGEPGQSQRSRRIRGGRF
jgi:hypothetical protein